MTDWPDPTRPGVPLNPERDGAHAIFDNTRNQEIAVVWCAKHGRWFDMASIMEPHGAAKWWRYLGPCLTPAEVKALVDAAYRRGQETRWAWAEKRAVPMTFSADLSAAEAHDRMSNAVETRYAIRALPIKESEHDG